MSNRLHNKDKIQSIRIKHRPTFEMLRRNKLPGTATQKKKLSIDSSSKRKNGGRGKEETTNQSTSPT